MSSFVANSRAKSASHSTLLTILLSATILAPTAPAFASAAYSFSTYFGGTNAVGSDFGTSVVTDDAGNVYVVGSTSASLDFPTTPGVVQPTKPGGTDGFVAKFDPTGALVYSTFLGGTNNDNPVALTVDGAGSVYVVGTTTSSDFPVTPGAVQPLFGGGSDAFVTKLSPDASSLVFSSYLGGSDTSEVAGGVAVDATGHVFVTGKSPSLDFPVTVGAFDTDCGLGGNCTTFNEDVFVTKLDPTGSSLIYSTFVGGNKRDFGHQLVLDASGTAYVVGTTASSDFPVVGAYDPTAGGALDGFLFALDATGSTLSYSTYLGGSGSDLVIGLDIDSAGDLYLGGYTRSDDFPTTAGAFDTVCGTTLSCAGSLDAFALKIRPDGTPPVYSTFLGGDGLEYGFGVAVDDDGQLHIAGTTTSLDFPTQDPIQGALTSDPTCFLDSVGIETGSPCSDLFVTKLTSDGSALLFSDYLGGSDGETRIVVPSFNHNLAINGLGEIHLVSVTHSSNYPVANAYQGTLVGDSDAVLTKITGVPGSDTTPPTADAGSNQAIHAGNLVVLDGSGSFDDNTASIDLLFQWSLTDQPGASTAVLAGAMTSSPSFVADAPGTYVASLIVTDEAGLDSVPDDVEISSLNVTPVADAGLDQIVVVGDLADLDGSASDDADSDPLSYSWLLTAAPAGSSATISGDTSVVATIQPDVVGAYVASLVVNDGFVDSVPDETQITAITASDFVEAKLLEGCDYVSLLPTGAFDAPGHQNALCNFMSQAINELSKGKISKAVSKIDKAIARTDGCAMNGSPDPKGGSGADWILSCTDQAPLYALLQEARDALD